MLKTYHLSFTSHNEVMYRSREDMGVAFNCLCSALYHTESRCLAESFMSDHHHGCYLTLYPRELVRTQRISYCKYFNHKYEREGPLGERGFFELEIMGLRHHLAALSYILKNAVHHGVTASPFAYPYCSANVYFMEALGKVESSSIIAAEDIRSALPRRAHFDPNWKMGNDGVFLRSSVIERSLVENMYSTPQAFNYYLFGKSGEDRIREQEEDGLSLAPITLEAIEAAILKQVSSPEKTVAAMLRNEKARYTTRRVSDMEVCHLIDNQYVPMYCKRSVYHLSDTEKNRIANELYHVYQARPQQIKRCLCF